MKQGMFWPSQCHCGTRNNQGLLRFDDRCGWRWQDGLLAVPLHRPGQYRGAAFPTIARELKLSISTARRAIHDLKAAGLLSTEQRYRANGGKSSLLYLLKR